MAFESGYRLGPYEILAPIGAGGMGEVWRARDTKLNREVAIKVLPAALANDPQYMARFEREAQTLAALHHPNIATVFGVEGTALVMELVDGPSLADRIAQGPIPIDEAISIARQIVEGLEAAHERGVIHRDLKPANIKLTSSGAVKLLDFGLAKSGGDSGAAAVAGMSPTISPTLSLAMTQAGMILGTAAYMPPEQARGKPVDRRADIWSFGVVFWEMLTGRQLFGGGETVTDTLASVVKDAPDLGALPADTPANVRRIVERCLRKDPRSRLRDIGEARVLLDEPIDVAPSAPATRAKPWPWVAAGVCALGLAAVSAVHFRESPASPPAPVRFEIAVPSTGEVGRYLTLSPDGHTLAWTDGTKIYLRAMDEFAPRILTPARVDGYMFWSPDGRQLGFQEEGKLKRISVSGGPVVAIGEAGRGPGFGTGLGKAWTADNKIIIGGNSRGLVALPLSGGTPQPVEMIGGMKDIASTSWPVVLPGGQQIMFLAHRVDRPATVMMANVRPDGKLENPRDVVLSRVGPQYFTDAEGRSHILFVNGSSLVAQPFDPRSGAVTGDPVVITDAIGIYLTRAFVAAANGGTIVFRSGENIGNRPEITDRTGSGTPISSVSGSAVELSLSPDGRRLLTTVNSGNLVSAVWILDPERGAHTRFTFDEVAASRPIWSPDGSRIAYSAAGIWVKPSNGSGAAEKIGSAVTPWAWSHDGKNLVVSPGPSARQESGLYLLPLTGDHAIVPLIHSKFLLRQAQFSPDDRWIAYVSDESGDFEVYVQAIGGSGERTRISNTGGVQPRWRRDGRELFYLEPRGKMMSVAIGYGKTLQADAPVALFDARLTSYTPNSPPRYDVSADGKKFYLSRFPEAQNTSPLRVILHWRGAGK